MCGLGRLYSKQSVIRQLNENNKMPEVCNHIESMKDIKELRFVTNPECSAVKRDNFIRALETRFVALWTCGCVFCEQALRQIETNVCSACQTPFNEEDIVVLNGTKDDVDLMRSRMNMRLMSEKVDEMQSVEELRIQRSKLLINAFAIYQCFEENCNVESHDSENE